MWLSVMYWNLHEKLNLLFDYWSDKNVKNWLSNYDFSIWNMRNWKATCNGSSVLCEYQQNSTRDEILLRRKSTKKFAILHAKNKINPTQKKNLIPSHEIARATAKKSLFFLILFVENSQETFHPQTKFRLKLRKNFD